MKKEVEVEYKSLLKSASHFEKIKKEVMTFANKKETYEQTNYFFDSESGILNKSKVTLRIRFKKNAWELTAKVKQESDIKGVTETIELNKDISEIDAMGFIKNGLDKEVEIVKEMLDMIGIESDYQFSFLGKLKTTRTDYILDDDIISLDENEYGEKMDWEFEWETLNHERVDEKNKLLKLEFGNGKGKRKRFLKELERLS